MIRVTPGYEEWEMVSVAEALSRIGYDFDRLCPTEDVKARFIDTKVAWNPKKGAAGHTLNPNKEDGSMWLYCGGGNVLHSFQIVNQSKTCGGSHHDYYYFGEWKVHLIVKMVSKNYGVSSSLNLHQELIIGT